MLWGQGRQLCTVSQQSTYLDHIIESLLYSSSYSPIALNPTRLDSPPGTETVRVESYIVRFSKIQVESCADVECTSIVSPFHGLGVSLRRNV